MSINVLRRRVQTGPACAANPDLFYSDDVVEIAEAKAICADCPLRAACLAGAMERHERWGVYGGKTPAERGAHYRRHQGVQASTVRARRARVVELSAHLTATEIAETLGVSIAVVSADRGRTGIAVGREGWAERRTQVYQLRDQGQTVAVIMLETGLGRRTVNRYLAERRRRQVREAAA